MKRKLAKCGFCKSEIRILVRGKIKEGYCQKCSKNITTENILDPERERPNPNLNDGQLGWSIKMKK